MIKKLAIDLVDISDKDFIEERRRSVPTGWSVRKNTGSGKY